MKAPKALNIQSADILKKSFLHTHDMQKMTEYYSKNPTGGCSDFSPHQEAPLDTLKCQSVKNSILNK